MVFTVLGVALAITRFSVGSKLFTGVEITRSDADGDAGIHTSSIIDTKNRNNSFVVFFILYSLINLDRNLEALSKENSRLTPPLSTFLY
jgi:hypothetical protein